MLWSCGEAEQGLTPVGIGVYQRRRREDIYN